MCPQSSSSPMLKIFLWSATFLTTSLKVLQVIWLWFNTATSDYAYIIRVFYPGACPSLQIQAPRPQFCPKADLPLQVAVSLWMNRCGSFPLLYAPHSLSLTSEQTLKIWKDPRGTNEVVRRVDLANWALWTSPKFTTGVKYQFHQGFWLNQISENR